MTPKLGSESDIERLVIAYMEREQDRAIRDYRAHRRRSSSSVPTLMVTAVALAVAAIGLGSYLQGPAHPASTAGLVAGSSTALASVAATDGTSGPVASSGAVIIALAGDAIGQYIDGSTTSDPFLITGYIVFVQRDCAAGGATGQVSSLVSPCNDGWFLSDQPAGARGPDGRLLAVRGYHLVVDPDGNLSPTLKKVVLRVHTHDPRSADCPVSVSDECVKAIVVETFSVPN